MTIRVLCFGLGPIGLGIARLAAQRSHLQIVAALDIDPAKIGCDLGDLLGGPPADIIVTGDLTEALACSPDVALHATGSRLSQITPELETLMAAGIRVISTCEELAYPWALQPQIAVNLDQLARTHGVVLLGTGVNPGYVMDTLPLLMSASCAIVRSVHVTRVVDVAPRRASLQHKVGAGLTPEAFAARVQEGTVGHVGLQESLNLLAGSFGWQLEKVEYEIEPIIARDDITTTAVAVKAGQVAGVHQVAAGRVYSKEVVRLDLQMAVGAADPRDEIIIAGNPPLHIRFQGGIPGDIATAAMIVNATPNVMHATPGLATMADVGVVHWRG